MKVVSEQIDNGSNNSQMSVVFEVDRGSIDIVVNDDNLTTYDACKERAEAEFLEKSYKHSKKTFKTYHIDNVELGDIVSCDGFIGYVESIKENVDGAKVSMQISLKAFV